MAFIHNVSLWICLYSLWLFYLSTKHYLRPFSPALKFGLIKSIIFISFWQKIVLQVAVASNVVKTPDEYSNREIMDGWNSFCSFWSACPSPSSIFRLWIGKSCTTGPKSLSLVRES